MGGYGSGPYGYMGSKRGRTATYACLSLDIRRLKRDRLLQPGKHSIWSWTRTIRGEKIESSIGIKVLSREEIQLKYTCTIDGEATPVETSVLLAFSPCNYGKDRVWFHCPRCSKRVALLYQKGIHFRCRHCHDLTYYSCQESGNITEEAERRVNAVLVKLKNKKQFGFDLMYHRPTRPKGMHWDTWCKLSNEYDEAQLQYIQSVHNKLAGYHMTM